ncbi:hypothetical protein TNIN_104951 [Trichonephila inaurata madagascariensis]|uniref:Uncharacterized protein n=1 Tax=Trichonephila inaurata madagascariensis TaxID=2747483 RepID=A0A8X6Y763_9ARAC|nr:hypothetical protein TNIN_104951 [Trichonephila inaurata madagascariensis]
MPIHGQKRNQRGKPQKYDKHVLLQPNHISTNFMLVSNPKLTEVTENNHWEDYSHSNNKRHCKPEKDEGLSKSENQAHQLQDIPSMESWNASHNRFPKLKPNLGFSQDPKAHEHDHPQLVL